VVRIFGGTKLGIGGLISSYRKAAQMALETSEILVKTVRVNIQVTFGYTDMNRVMRIIKQNQLKIISQHLEMDCRLTVSTIKSKVQENILKFNALKGVIAEPSDS